MNINTESLERILSKKRDKIPALLEVFKITGRLCKIDDDVFNANFNLAIDKVENLLRLEGQSKKTCGYVLTESDYKSVGIFENHLEKLRRKSKKSPIKNQLIKLMPKLYKIKRDKHFSYDELKGYVYKKYKIQVSKSYLFEVFKTINA